MTEALTAIAAFTSLLRSLLLAGGVAVAAIAVTDWAVRTRRLSPFSGVARLMRSQVDPRIAGIERQVVRTGGHQSATPWWALVAYAILATLLIALVDTFADVLRDALLATSAGPRGILALLLHWIFRLLGFALLIRVISSWFPRAANSIWVRWSFPATEWMLRPLRGLVPSFGMIDITPIVAYFALQIAEWLVGRLIFPAF